MIKVGKVNYLNTLPLFYRWESHNIALVEGHPSQLVEKLRSGEIHAGIVSSVEYIFHRESYRLVPSICIASKKKACSVLLFSNLSIDKVSRVYLTPASLTSKVLARYIMKAVYHNEPEEVETKEDAQALLLIGDQALEEKLTGRWKFVYDLGEEWYSLHKLPFVFALFLVRKDAPQGLELLIEKQCKTSKVEFFKDLSESRLKAQGYPQSFLREYFSSCLWYDLGEEEELSLKVFEEVVKEELFNQRHFSKSDVRMFENYTTGI
ncbi:MAG: menaquinone biosynthesis protein [Aquificaceae bacterium]|nr:menaquinone biosynthesis protein [Aquificaceae bacterium]